MSTTLTCDIGFAGDAFLLETLAGDGTGARRHGRIHAVSDRANGIDLLERGKSDVD